MIVYLNERVTKVLHKELTDIHADILGNKDSQIDLAKYTRQEVERLEKMLATSSILGTKVIAADIRKYMKACDSGIDDIASRTVRQAAWLLEHYVAKLPNHILFAQDSFEGGSHVGYYVEDVRYLPEDNWGDNKKPERVEITLVYVDCDNRHEEKHTLTSRSVMGKTARESLGALNLIPETTKLMKKLEEETNRYYEVYEQVGKKFVASGWGLADLDDTTQQKYSAFYSRDKKIRLDNFGKKSHVVVDVLMESDSRSGSHRRGHRDSAQVNLYRWHKQNLRYFSPSEDELVRFMEADEDTEEAPVCQVPVHPLVPCFDLTRHTRLRVHVNNLNEYKYDRGLANNLVIPERDRQMINLLVNKSSNTFQDVVSGKGSSLNILSEGLPGTGKTVSAEVFAEFKERPLYSIQCSQLGMQPDEVEKNLSVILSRANRWNAILLLDEADVYIRKRKDDMKHNAIVGVFLRILEYASCILFMTTNLPDDVDDAIASRCIVRLRYDLPTVDAQVQIWQNLARVNNLDLDKDVIREFADKHPKLSGRDVKNLLKLASFVAEDSGQPLTVESLEFALQFKPTSNQ